mmetsp:Transcript_6860/g.9996  ORF Transcript_6860/g.9996 Transcript_6860/m.9996 type:complete len:513 (-) Transcript_6860:702-2240(-)
MIHHNGINMKNCCVGLVPIQTKHSSISCSAQNTGTSNSIAAATIRKSPNTRHTARIKLFSIGTTLHERCEEESVVLGRKEFLRAYHSTCPYRNLQGGDPRLLCRECQHIWEWGKTSLSRAMLKVTRSTVNDVQSNSTNQERYHFYVNGPNAFLINLNDVPVISDDNCDMTTDNPDENSNQTSQWKGGLWVAHPTSETTILSIVSKLTFQFQVIDDEHKNLTEVNENEVIAIASILDTPSPEATDTTLSNFQLNQEVPQPYHIGNASSSSSGSEPVIEHVRNTIEKKQSIDQPKSESASSASTNPSYLASTISVTDESCTTDPRSDDRKIKDSPKNHYVIYILPLGKTLPRQRIDILTRKLQRIPNVTIVPSVDQKNRSLLLTTHPNIQKITHIVVDEKVSVDEVASYFELRNEEELVRLINREGITTVTPDWIVQCPDSCTELLGEPSLMQIWHNLDIASTKLPDNSGWIKRKRPPQEIDYIGSVKVIKASEVIENNGIVSKIIKKRRIDSE